MSHPDFFSAAKLNGYVPPNKEVLYLLLKLLEHNYGCISIVISMCFLLTSHILPTLLKM